MFMRLLYHKPPLSWARETEIWYNMRVKKFKLNNLKLLVTAGLAMFAGGCMWGRMQVNDPTIADRAAAIRPGVTRSSEVPAILQAQPMMRMPGKDTTMQGYSYADTKSGGLMLVLFNFNRSTTVADTLYVEIDNRTDLVTRVYIPPRRDPEWRFWPFSEE